MMDKQVLKMYFYPLSNVCLVNCVKESNEGLAMQDHLPLKLSSEPTALAMAAYSLVEPFQMSVAAPGNLTTCSSVQSNA